MTQLLAQPSIVTLGPEHLDACDALLVDRLPRWTRTRLADDLWRPDRHWRGAWDDQELIGLTGAWDAPDVAHLMAVAVTARWEGQGLGARLLDDATRGARERGLPGMTLEVRTGNRRAIALYQSRGFATVGTRPKYFDGEDATLMSLPFAAAT